MNDNRALVKVDQPSLPSLEADVIRLRESCRRVIDELERRYRRVVTLPARTKAAVKRAPAKVLHAISAHPIVAIASVAVIVTAVVLLQRRR